MNHVERFKAVVKGQPVDRLPKLEWAVWWNETIDRWRKEGLQEFDASRFSAGTNPTANYSPDRYCLYDHFGLDQYFQLWFDSRGPECPPPNGEGGAIISNEEEYERIKPLLYPKIDKAIIDIQPWAERQRRGESLNWITLEGFFWFPRLLFGIENHLLAFFEQPDLMKRINQDNADYHIYILKKLAEADCLPTFAVFSEDMSYNNGPMLSEMLFDEYMEPYYRQVIPLMEELGILPIVDSDGDITVMIPWLEKVGIKGALPLEFQAGVDANKIREAHPEFVIIGNFNKLVMDQGEEAIRAEFERLLPVMRSGRYIPSPDHQTPPAVSLKQYQVYLRLLDEYCRKAND
ncbi:MAG: uroporphyrinogen decarboxylase family protein [Bacteroidota bacterium]